jgi:protein-tyrosine kinase
MSLAGQQADSGRAESAAESPIAEQMAELFQTVCTVGPRGRANLIVFLAAHAGCGASTIAREFARVVALDLGRRVLLLDAKRVPTQPAALGVTVGDGWEQAAVVGAPLDSVAVSVPGTARLRVAVLSTHGGGAVILDSTEFEGALAAVRNGCDLIVVDGPAPAESVDSLLLSRVADGCVLVVEAERTRWQVAENVKQRVAKHGGQVLGVVLNKRRHHIPRVVYDRL